MIQTPNSAVTSSGILNDNSYQCETSSYRMKVTFSNEKLCISLQDLINWVKYYSQYSENDIGGQIHRKVDLLDLHYSLTHAFIQQTGDIKQHSLGELVKNDGVPYYKVENGGKVSVYVCMMDQRKKENVQYQSKLLLNKKADMTEVEICKQKLAMLSQKYSKIQGLLTNRQQQICQLKQEIVNKNMIISQNAEFKVKICKIPNSFTFGCPANNSNYCNHVFRRIIPYGQVYKFKILIASASSRYVGIGVTDCSKHLNNISSVYNSDYIVAYYWWNINQGHKYPGGAVQGSGYNVGETVQIAVDLANQRITWSVSGTVRATHNHQMLSDRQKTFMPFVDTYYAGTQVQWIQ